VLQCLSGFGGGDLLGDEAATAWLGLEEEGKAEAAKFVLSLFEKTANPRDRSKRGSVIDALGSQIGRSAGASCDGNSDCPKLLTGTSFRTQRVLRPESG
jgi:hypothetical protein